MLIGILILLFLSWYIGYLVAFQITITRCINNDEPLKKNDIKDIKHMSLMSWLWIYILFTEK